MLPMALERVRSMVPSVLLTGLAVLFASSPAYAATFTVNSNGDAPDSNLADNACSTSGLVCTLRAAIQQANATAGTDTIAFSIAGTISPASALPDVTQPVTIGSTAPGCGGAPSVVLNGASAGAANGLTLAVGSSGSKICTLVVQGFSGHGIVVSSNGNTLTRNYAGTNAAGSAAAGNGGYGIVVLGSNNVLGAANYAERDLVSGNASGGVYVGGGTGNQLLFSYVGTNLAGTGAVANAGSGVTLDQASSNTLVQNVISGNTVDGVRILGGGSNSIVTNNLIGLNAAGTAAVANGNHGVYIESSTSNNIGNLNNGNVISGNAFAGVYITGPSSTGNLIRGNFIGTRLSGTQAQANAGPGVGIVNAGANKVGEAALGMGNVISGNTGPGVLIQGGGGNEVLSNTIGTTPDGNSALANGGHGVVVQDSPNNTIGRDSTSASGNMISGNGGNGVYVTGSASSGTVVAGNTIGARQDGVVAIPNAGHGIALVGVSNATIGGDTSGEDNEIAGNAQNGVYISGGSGNVVLVNEIGIDGTGTVAVPNGLAGIVIENSAGSTSVQSSLVSGNTGEGIRLVGGSGTLLIADLVGTNVLGTQAVPNGGHGISIENSANNTVGQPVSGQGNVVSGNGGSGFSITGALSTGNVVRNTVIGLNLSAGGPLPNSGHGVYIQGASANTIGGSALTSSNRIAGNVGAGVAILSGSSNRIRLNLIYSNGRLGIDLDRDGSLPLDGVSFNDPGDVDGGANALQNFPVLTAATSTTVSGTVRGIPGRTYIIDLFGSSGCDTAGFGEGTAFEGTSNVTTDGSGVATFLMGFPSVGAGTVFAATATDNVTGNTSELSQCIAVSHVPVDTLTLFNPAQGWVALIGSPVDFPPLDAYETYVATAPVQGQWVMGDWNGDGIETPAVYGDNGAFYYTNDVGQTTNWTGIWFGLLGHPPVAGRFDAVVDHDCLGVVDSAPWPGFGTAFTMYFTCDLNSGADPPKDAQWLGAVLPDSDGFSGPHQFAAGDFDGDGIDSIAVRRGPYVAWTNVPPTTLLSAYDQAQYIGAPGAGTGQLVTGDWDGDGLDSFGLLYQDAAASFYRRNDLQWNSGAYVLQHVGQPIGPAATAQSWRPGSSAGNP
jgi:parallel beta-helix repeat protein